MGFGLHVGWAIEGAIGSEYKIDASYLSPNVNMASRLEARNKGWPLHTHVRGLRADAVAAGGCGCLYRLCYSFSPLPQSSSACMAYRIIET